MINLQAIRYFAMVARYEHYTKAANELYITQSTLSKAIEGLEDELGVKLFEKQGRNVRLTFYGRILRDYVQRGTAEIEKGVMTVQTLANEQSGTVRLAAIYSAGSLLLPQYMKGFSEESAIIGLVRAGLGLGMITDSNYLSLDGVVKVHITQSCFFRNIYMVWNQDRQMTPPAKAFRRYILSAL